MCQSTIQSARIFLLAATLRIYKQSQYREQEKPVLLVNSCVILRMEIIPPPTQISITTIQVTFTVHLLFYCRH